jgi:hypothetical protein
MWNLFSCYLSGRHDFGMWCEPGAIFLRCVHCGKRSSGWTVAPKPVAAVQRAMVAPVRRSAATVAPAAVVSGAVVSAAAKRRVLPFGRVAAR